MAGNNWLASPRSEAAVDRILDAAGELFARRPAASVGMNEIARAAGCSRATLYRYFENREALYTAYVHREAYAVHHQLLESLEGIDDPRQRLVQALLTSLRLVRNNAALQSWFAAGTAPIGAEIAESSDVVKAMSAAFVVSLSPGDPDTDPEAVERKARWIVRVLTSLLLFPGRDDDDERRMTEEFLAPVVTPRDQATQ
ncbi:TetR/AcrR family transcriptional regulator [[Mycobacterium] wendilense]|uniref:TetR/AcrR family transcriptional regulator n=1 Tax=[Mycobacterium] wendilense TaxID=3064284 RepID=A0ABM9MAZ6_9MYCO|nr:TetR/AcrR family transcriptional regulator [Mycolicibacterium sp. MU0050]CAJ1580785.1 TetR/AcrR family transcriptional regulator [Mycolicibacterium sp. MU0050]